MVNSRIVQGTRSVLAIAAALLLNAGAAAPVLAHHSFAMFDATRCLRVGGTVKQFDWTFPHSWLWLVVADGKGATQVWGFEGIPPAQLARETGWKRSWLKAGDKITVMFNPLRSGEHGGAYVRVQLADGRTITTMSDHAAPCGPGPSSQRPNP